MILSQQAIIDFKKVYSQDFGEEIDDNQAQELGIKLLEFFSLIYRPIPKDVNAVQQITKQNKYEKHNK